MKLQVTHRIKQTERKGRIAMNITLLCSCTNCAHLNIKLYTFTFINTVVYCWFYVMQQFLQIKYSRFLLPPHSGGLLQLNLHLHVIAVERLCLHFSVKHLPTHTHLHRHRHTDASTQNATVCQNLAVSSHANSEIAKRMVREQSFCALILKSFTM